MKNVWAGRIVDIFCLDSFFVQVKELKPTGARGSLTCIPGSRALSVTARDSILYIVDLITKNLSDFRSFGLVFVG